MYTEENILIYSLFFIYSKRKIFFNLKIFINQLLLFFFKLYF